MSREKMVELPPGLKETRQRFEHWRRTRRSRSRIPDSLWAAAAKMAERYGIHRTARALGLGYYSLKERTEKAACGAGESEGEGMPTFVELAGPVPANTCRCIVELEDRSGAKMRIHLQGVGAPDLVALARSFRESDA